MERHLDFEEVIEYIYCTELNPESARLAQKVNSHLLVCESCRRLYRSLLQIYEEVNLKEKIQYIDEEQRELLIYLARSSEFQQNRNPVIQQWICSMCKYSIALVVEVKDKTKLLLNKINVIDGFSDICFEYPLALGTRDGEKSCETESILIDEDNANNKIELHDGRTTIFLDIDEWDRKQPELIVIDERGELVCATKMLQQESTWVGEFSSTVETKYKIFIK